MLAQTPVVPALLFFAALQNSEHLLTVVKILSLVVTLVKAFLAGANSCLLPPLLAHYTLYKPFRFTEHYLLAALLIVFISGDGLIPLPTVKIPVTRLLVVYSASHNRPYATIPV